MPPFSGLKGSISRRGQLSGGDTTPPRMAYRDGHRCQETMGLAERASQRRWWEKRERESTEKAGIQRDRRMCLPRDAKRFVYASATQASLAWLFVPHCSLLWRDVQLACPDRSIGFWVCVDKSGSRAGNETGILLSLYYFIKYKIICIRQNLSDHSNSSVKMCIYILIYIIRVRSGTFYLTIQAQVLILSGGF